MVHQQARSTEARNAPIVSPERASTTSANPARPGHADRRVQRRRKAGLVLVGLGLAGAYLQATMADDLPSWAALPMAQAQAAPPAAQVAGADAGSPVFGTTPLVNHLERGMVAQEDSIDVSRWADSVGDAGVREAAVLAQAVNPYVFVNGWSVAVAGDTTLVKPTYLYSADEAERRRVDLGESATP